MPEEQKRTHEKIMYRTDPQFLEIHHRMPCAMKIIREGDNYLLRRQFDGDGEREVALTRQDLGGKVTYQATESGEALWYTLESDGRLCQADSEGEFACYPSVEDLV